MEFINNSNFKLIFISLISASFGIKGLFYFIRRYKFKEGCENLKTLRNARILQKKKNTEKFKKYLNESNVEVDEDAIIKKSFVELLKYLQSDSKSKDQVLYCYQKKALEVNENLNCVVDFVKVDKSEINFDGPLAGLPVSLKDNYLLKGTEWVSRHQSLMKNRRVIFQCLKTNDYYSCAGCSYFLTKPTDTNCVLVDVIKDLGGVPFVKTSVPQGMMSILSSNPIDGITLNPIDPFKSPGGSSSGEGALIGAHGSIVGLGTDLGGSVRIPASFCGISGFKPTNERLSKKGLMSFGGQTLVQGTCGIMGRDVESIAFLFQHIVNSSLHRVLDPTVVPLDFRTNLYQSNEKLCIGYFDYNDSFRCVPSMERVVHESVYRLQRNGHKIVKWKPPISGEKSLKMFIQALCIDRGRGLQDVCHYDEKDPTIAGMLNMMQNNVFQYLYKTMQARLMGKKELLMWLSATQGISSCEDFIRLVEDISHLRTKIIKEWERLKIDVVICPALGFTALPLKPIGNYTGMLSYQNLWNLVNFPAGTIPVSKVNKNDITKLKEEYPKKLSLWHHYTYLNQVDSIDMPVSVQCVAKPWNDEMCLRIMRELII